MIRQLRDKKVIFFDVGYTLDRQPFVFDKIQLLRYPLARNLRIHFFSTGYHRPVF